MKSLKYKYSQTTFFPPQSSLWPWVFDFTGRSAKKTGSRSGHICLPAFQWLGTLLSTAEKNENPLLWEMQTHAAGMLTHNAPHTHSQTLTRPYNKTEQSHTMPPKHSTCKQTSTHTHLLLVHCKQWHNQTGSVQWCCLNGVKQWGSLASESSQMMRVPGAWIGGFSLLHTRSSGPDNMHQCAARCCGPKYQSLAWGRRLISMQANSTVLANLQVCSILHRCSGRRDVLEN